MTRLLLVFSLLALLPGRADAQQRQRVVERLRPDAHIRIRTVRNGLHTGRFLGADADTLFLDPVDGAARVAVADVSDLWVRGTAAKTGAVIGGVAGGVGTGLFFMWIVSALCESSDCETAEAGLIGLGFGGAAGALVGLVLGTFVDKWHRRFP